MASAQTTVSDIADAAGITRRTVYRYFTSTEELFTAVADVALGSSSRPKHQLGRTWAAARTRDERDYPNRRSLTRRRCAGS